MGAEYNDNINLSEVDEQEDIILRPQINFDAIWPITQLNTLRLDIGLGYSWYLDHSNANTNGVLIQPGSQLAFDIFVGDFRINIHDRPSLQQDPIAQLALSNVVDYGRFENVAGVSVLWDLNKALLTVGYDHYTYISTTEMFDYLNRNAEMFSGSMSFSVASTTSVGVEGYAVFTYFDDDVLNDSIPIRGSICRDPAQQLSESAFGRRISMDQFDSSTVTPRPGWPRFVSRSRGLVRLVWQYPDRTSDQRDP